MLHWGKGAGRVDHTQNHSKSPHIAKSPKGRVRQIELLPGEKGEHLRSLELPRVVWLDMVHAMVHLLANKESPDLSR